MRTAIAQAGLPASDPLAATPTVLAAFDAAIRLVDLVSGLGARVQADAQSLEAGAAAAFVPAAGEAVRAGIEDAAGAADTAAGVIAATASELNDYIRGAREAFELAADTMRAVMHGVTLAEAAGARIAEEATLLGERLSSAIAAARDAGAENQTARFDAVRDILDALDLSLSAVTAPDGTIASLEDTIADLRTQITEAQSVLDTAAGGAGPSLTPFADRLTALEATLDTARDFANDLAGHVGTLRSALDAASDITALQNTVNTLLIDSASDLNPLLGDFVADVVPLLDLSDLDLAAAARAAGSLGTATEAFDLLVEAALPDSITNAAEAIAQISLDPPDLSELRYGALVGISQISLKSLAQAVQTTIDTMLSDASGGTGVSVLDQKLPILGKSLAELTGLNDALRALSGYIEAAPDAGIAQLEAIIRQALPENSPLVVRIDVPETLDVTEANRLSLMVGVEVPDDIAVTELNLAAFTDFLGIPMPELPPLTGLTVDLSGTVREQLDTLELTPAQVQTLVPPGQVLAEGDQLQALDADGNVLAIGAVRSVDYRFADGSAAVSADATDAGGVLPRHVVSVAWDREWVADETAGQSIARASLAADRTVQLSLLPLTAGIVTDQGTPTDPLWGAFRFDVDLRGASVGWDSFDASALSSEIGSDFHVIRDGTLVARGTLTGTTSENASVFVRSGAIQLGDTLVINGGPSFTVSRAEVVPLELVDEFSSRLGADVSLNLADGASLFAFDTELLGAAAVSIEIASPDSGVQELARAAMRLQLGGDGIPAFSPIVPQFEPSRLVPSSALELRSDAELEVRATITLDVVAGAPVTQTVSLGLATLSAQLKDGTITAPNIALAGGSLIDALRVQLNALIAETAGAFTALAADWSDISRFQDGLELALAQVFGDLDRSDGLIDMVIPGLGQSVEDLTGIKSALREVLSELEGARDQALDFGAQIIHDALSDATDPLRFDPDELTVSLTPAGTGAVTADAIVLRVKGARMFEDAMALGLDLSALNIGDTSALASVLGLSDPGLLSISALDEAQLRYALSLVLDLAIEIGWDDTENEPTLTFLREDPATGQYVPVSDAVPSNPLELQVLAGMEPTDISFAIDAGSLGRYGVVARDTGFAFGRDEDVQIGSGSLADQLPDIGARFGISVGTGNDISAFADAGFSIGLDLARQFGNALQAIDGFSEARLEGLFSLPDTLPDGVLPGTSLAQLAPSISLDFIDMPENIDLRSLLIPQLNDFSGFTLADIANMAITAREWISGDGLDLIQTELPFIGRSIDDILPVASVFEAIDAVLDQIPAGSFPEQVLLVEAAVNTALGSIPGWENPPVFGLIFSTLPGDPWTGGVPLRGLEMQLDFDQAVIATQALDLDLAEAVGLSGDLDATLNASLEAGVKIAGQLVFGGALSADVSQRTLDDLADDPALLRPTFYVGATSGLELGFKALAEDVSIRLGFTGTDLAGRVDGGTIALGGTGDAEYATLSYGLGGKEGQYFVFDTGGLSLEGGYVTGLAESTGGQVAVVSLSTDMVLGGSVQVVNTSLTDRLLAARPTSAAEIAAHTAAWNEAAGIGLGVITSTGNEMRLDVLRSGSTLAPIENGDTLMRVVADARYDAAAVRDAGQVQLTLTDASSGAAIPASVFAGTSHAQLSFSVGGAFKQLALPLILPEDLSANTVNVLLPDDVLTGAWTDVSLAVLASQASVTAEPMVVSHGDLDFIYDLSFASDAAATAFLAALEGVGTAANADEGSIAFGATGISGRVLAVDEVARTVTVVLDAGHDVDLQSDLRAGRIADLLPLIQADRVSQGVAPIFSVSALGAELDAAVSVNFEARADFIDVTLGKINGTVEIGEFGDLDPVTLFTELKDATPDADLGFFDPAGLASGLSGFVDEQLNLLQNARDALSRITPAQLISYIRAGLTALTEGGGTAAALLDTDIPLIDKSLDDLTGVKAALSGLLDLLPADPSVSLSDWVAQVNGTLGLPEGFLTLGYREAALGAWVLDIAIDYRMVVQETDTVTLKLDGLGPIGPISGSALSDGITLDMGVDGAAQLVLNLALHGQGLRPLELRLRDSSNLDFAFGLRLNQPGSATIGLSDEAQDIIDALTGSGDPFKPELAITGGAMWLSSSPEAQEQVLKIGPPVGQTLANFTDETFAIGQLVTSTPAGAGFMPADATFGIVTGWDLATQTLTILAPSGAEGARFNVFEAGTDLRIVNPDGTLPGGNPFEVIQSSGPAAGEVSGQLLTTADDLLESGDIIGASDGTVWLGEVDAVSDGQLLASVETGGIALDGAQIDRFAAFENGERIAQGDLANTPLGLDQAAREVSAIVSTSDLALAGEKTSVVTFAGGVAGVSVGELLVDGANRWFEITTISGSEVTLEGRGHGAPVGAGSALQSAPRISAITDTAVLSADETRYRAAIDNWTGPTSDLEGSYVLDSSGRWFEIVRLTAQVRVYGWCRAAMMARRLRARASLRQLLTLLQVKRLRLLRAQNVCASAWTRPQGLGPGSAICGS